MSLYLSLFWCVHLHAFAPNVYMRLVKCTCSCLSSMPAKPLSISLAPAETGVTLKGWACVVTEDFGQQRQNKCHLAYCLWVRMWMCVTTVKNTHCKRLIFPYCEHSESCRATTIEFTFIYWLPYGLTVKVIMAQERTIWKLMFSCLFWTHSVTLDENCEHNWMLAVVLSTINAKSFENYKR